MAPTLSMAPCPARDKAVCHVEYALTVGEFPSVGPSACTGAMRERLVARAAQHPR